MTKDKTRDIIKAVTKRSAKMAKFKIDKDKVKAKTINRTIRLKEATFNQLAELSRQSGVSFNKVVAECIDYALSHM